MRDETAEALIARIRSIEADVGAMQAAVEAEELAPSQRQYLARCFDLLHMELAAVRIYIDGLR